MNEFDDDELKKILKPLDRIYPSEFEISKWKSISKPTRNAVRSEKISKSRELFHLAVALFIGFILGGLFFAKAFHRLNHNEAIENMIVNETFERVHVNLD